MAVGLRQRRIENEWCLLCEHTKVEPGVRVKSRFNQGDADLFEIVLTDSPALVRGERGLSILRSHEVTLRFPRFFPALPIEAYVHEQIFHPNVNPENGFVCLWSVHAVENTSVHALRQLNSVMAWRLFNAQALHVFQPEALAWYDSLLRYDWPVEKECRHISQPQPYSLP